LIFVKPKPKTKQKKSGTKKAYNFQLKILQAPGIRQRGKARAERRGNTKARGGSKPRELGCQGRKGRSDGDETEGGTEERERGSEQTTVDKRDHPFLDQ
jgi:hypothetical protein